MSQAKMKQKPKKELEQRWITKMTVLGTILAAIITAIAAIIVAVINKSSQPIPSPPNPPPQESVQLNPEAFGLLWNIHKGDPRTSPDEIRLDGPADIQTNDTYRFGNLVITARSDQWLSDTSIGFEMWDPGRYSIRVDSGKLIIRNHGADIKRFDIPNWLALKKENLTIKICWAMGQVKLHINGQELYTYANTQVPTRPLKIRLNAAAGDVLSISQVEVSPTICDLYSSQTTCSYSPRSSIVYLH